MSEERELDLQNALERGTKKMNLADLQQKGFKSVKVLDEKTMEQIVRKAVDRVVSTQTAEEKARIVEESQKELDRLMKEHRAVKTGAQLLEADKNELVERVEALQRELELKSELEEERLHKKFAEGTASMQKQVEEVKRRAEATGRELENLRVENARLEATLQAEREKVARLRETEPRLEAALKDIQDLNRQNARYQTELEGAGKRLNELESELEREQSRLREAEHARTEMVEQVLKLQARGVDAAKSSKELESARAQLARAEELVRDGAKENGALKARVAEFDARAQELQLGLNKATAEASRLEGENGPLRKEVDHLRAGVAALEAGLTEERSKSQAASGDSAALRERLEAAEARAQERQAALDRAHADREALEKDLDEQRSRVHGASGESATLRERLDASETRVREKQEALDRALADASAFEKALNEERSRAQGVSGESAALRDRLESAESQAREQRVALDRALADAAALEKSLAQERSKSQAALGEAAAHLARLDDTKARELEIQKRLAEADRVEVERVGLQQELTRLRADLSGIETLRQECDAAFAALQESKDEAAALRMEIARREKEQEAQQEKIVVVASDLEEIEERHRSEQQELEGLRQKSQQLEEALAKTRQDLAQAHSEMQSLQEILQHEQEVSRSAHVESTAAQSRLQELSSSAARLGEQARGLEEENAKLQERLEAASLSNSAASALDHRLAAVERLMDAARQQGGTARASAADSKAAADELRKTILLQNRPKRKPGSKVQGGVALDGHALLQEFFRRIRLKERLQKHVPVREKDGQRHPSELLVDVVSALIAGDRRAGKEKKGAELEILGPARGPDVADLRQFLDRVSPQAGHAVSRVHDALRHNLFSMPERPGRLVLDVGSVDLPRSYRPLVAYEPESKEFWHGQLRTTADRDTQGIVPFLKECVSKVPGGFPRSRVRFRLDARYFSEDVIRFLNSRGCSYVMEAPSLAGIREKAKNAKFRELSNGWEAGEFQQRIHPIRKTLGRFVVARHRLSRKERPEKPMFRDKTWEYCVFVVDSKISPWRAYQTFAGRPSSQAESASLLNDFTKSKLLGRRRRSHGALFPLYLMASDLVQWFRRKALPVDERGRDLDSLRTELLRLPTTQERMGLTRLPVLSKRDKSRKSFERVTRKIRRLRPVRPFKFRK
jgi:DNA repair exonuclease SbcCD ATPase subunit